MEILQLRYFQKVAYLEHMTKAAEELCISQPSLSTTIRLLEKELGVSLFDRNGKYIKLNEYGKAFLRRVDAALAAIDDGKKVLESMRGEGGEHIRLAFLAASPLIPDLLSTFRDRYPKANFHLLQHLPKYKSNDFDLCISPLPLKIEGITSVPLLTEKFYLAVPKRHPMAERDSISLYETLNEGFILLKPGHTFRELTDNFCSTAGIVPKVIFESDDPATLRGLIKAGQGIGFMPALSWGDITSSSIKLLEIENPVCVRTIGLSWMENRYQPNLVKIFHKFTVEFFSNLSR